MQPLPKNDLVYLLGILEAAGKISIYTSSFSNAFDFYQANDQLNFNASLLMVATIGDQVAKVSAATKEKHRDIPWLKIKDTRNRIVHDYSGVDFDITYHILCTEIPKLKIQLEKLVKAELLSGTFSLEEVNVACNSTWYKHVDFSALM